MLSLIGLNQGRSKSKSNHWNFEKKKKILEYRVLKVLSSETDFQGNFQSVDTLPSSVPWLRLICCSINQNRKRLRLSSCRLHLTFLRLGSMSTDWKFRWKSVSELSTLRTLSEISFISNLILADFWQFTPNLWAIMRPLREKNLKINERILKKIHFLFRLLYFFKQGSRHSRPKAAETSSESKS